VTCRHGILGRRSGERRVAATKVARPLGRKKESAVSTESLEIGVSASSKARNESRQARVNVAERVVPVTWISVPPPLPFISL